MKPCLVGMGARQRGFTLLEIMVVLVIVGVFISLAALSIKGPDRVDALEQEARRLSALIDMAAQESVLQGQEMMVELELHGYEFKRFNGEKWLAIEDDELFRPRRLDDDMELDAVIEGAKMQSLLFEGRKASQLFILSSGEMSPFEITLELRDGPMFRLKGTMMGALTLEGPMESS